MLKKVALWTLLLGFSRIAFCQEIIDENEPYHPHRFTIMMANSHIPSADNLDGQSEVFIAATWGFNYDYWFTHKWAVGLHTDVVLQQFEIEEKGSNKVIERSAPLAVTGVALFKPWEKWTILIGLGREFEKSESFNMVSAGLEYGVELSKDWELSFNLIFDNKIEAYDTWMFGIGFSKLVGKRHRYAD